MAAGIFDRQSEVRPSKLKAVAERRFDDAQALRDTGDNARANGAMYLAGIVIEILLKSQLMRQYSAIGRRRPAELAEADREVWSLIWRSHDLAEMLDRLRDLQAALAKRGENDGRPYLEWLRGICGTWSIQARYSTRTATIMEAMEFLDRVRQLKELLK